MAKPYHCDLADSADCVDSAAWRSVCGAGGNPFLDLRFLQAVEESFRADARLWYAIFRDEFGTPVACTCFSRYLVDGALLAPPAAQRFFAAVRRVWPSCFKFRILLGGLPVSTCGNVLAVARPVDDERLAASLNEVAEGLARANGCGLISFKEFAPADATRVAALAGHDYLKATSVVAYSLPCEFDSFEGYQASRSKRTRANIRRHFRKFEEAGLTCEHLRGRDGVERLFTDDVHRLYLNVLDRAATRFECVPAEFFRQLALRLPDESCFTVIRRGERIVGFCCGVAAGKAHTMLFCGLDYSLNAEADLYFNIIYRGLAQGLRPGVEAVHIGASADEFKQHMGCHGEPLSIQVKAVGAVGQFVLRRVFGLLFDTTSTTQPTVAAPEIAAPVVPAPQTPDRTAA